jgi:hypothetical protein
MMVMIVIMTSNSLKMIRSVMLRMLHKTEMIATTRALF